ncbi:GerAB/ArcD/ProY family transporter [Bacillus sp. ISL-7]|uniref:GerAB/ArcD/ProY family transporter n=1 Tax=Bacillus sp. ISL-7 TaxID=2819136 RepID=UPI001BEC2F0E|nr:GerAB/ArcD/ProY family transporter [Bacillus sp. ISL-7]MBT2738873.1 GerAB/ArcD/ProY family transporter [Bacillus sp. ISL-7]
MEIEKISSGQFFILIFLFEMGTALVLPIGFSSHKDVWLSILIASVGGILLFLLYDYLFREYPNFLLSGYVRKILGRNLGWIVSLLYAILFIYTASRDLRETGGLLVSSVYNQTPLMVIETMLIIVIIYALYKGLEVLARTAEIYFVVLICFGLLGSTSVLLSGIVNISNFQPILENGWKPVLKSAYPNILMFPFGEIFCFSTIFPNLNKTQSGRKVGVAALTVSTLILSFIHALEISVLGETSYSTSAFPLLRMIQKAHIGELLERLDIFAIIALIICVFFKISIYLLAAINIISDIFNVENKQKLTVPIAFIALLSSLIMASNISEHFKEGEWVIKFLLPIFFVAIPVLLVVVHWIRKRLNSL